jgi:putative oxidoreductase
MKLIETACTRIDRASNSLAWLPPLLLRVVLGVTFLLTGWGKLHNLEQVTRFFDSLGIPGASVQAPFVATLEFVGGILILAGLGTRIAAIFLITVMAVAIATAIWPKQSLTDVLGSIEAVYLAGFVYLAIAGAGALSLDRVAARFIGRAARRPAART